MPKAVTTQKSSVQTKPSAATQPSTEPQKLTLVEYMSSVDGIDIERIQRVVTDFCSRAPAPEYYAPDHLLSAKLQANIGARDLEFLILWLFEATLPRHDIGLQLAHPPYGHHMCSPEDLEPQYQYSTKLWQKFLEFKKISPEITREEFDELHKQYWQFESTARFYTNYSILQAGTCQTRASYAALELCRALSESARVHPESASITIYRRYFQEKNQHVVLLRKSNSPLYVYDALLDPEHVRTFENYSKEILPHMPDAPTRRAAEKSYTFPITQAHIDWAVKTHQMRVAHIQNLLPSETHLLSSVDHSNLVGYSSKTKNNATQLLRQRIQDGPKIPSLQPKPTPTQAAGSASSHLPAAGSAPVSLPVLTLQTSPTIVQDNALSTAWTRWSPSL